MLLHLKTLSNSSLLSLVDDEIEKEEERKFDLN